MNHGYLDSPRDFKIFAHRGLVYQNDLVTFDENTIPAFANALACGAEYLELDVQASHEGVAVVFHDETLNRVSTHSGKLSERSWYEIQKIRLLNGYIIPSLDQVLEYFPTTKINIDVKATAAIADLIATINRHKAEHRVLITSFDEHRRKLALAGCPGAATSPSAILLLRIKLAQTLGFGLAKLLKKVNVLQIPVSYGILRLDSPKFIESVKRHGVEVVYWTINDLAEAKRLRDLGANGIVTDRTDLLAKSLI